MLIQLKKQSNNILVPNSKQTEQALKYYGKSIVLVLDLWCDMDSYKKNGDEISKDMFDRGWAELEEKLKKGGHLL